MAERGEPLTEREREVLELVATGITNREVAQKLFISVNTVKVHLRNVYSKLGADSRTEATMIAVREGWVGVGEGAASEPSPAEQEVPTGPPLPWTKRAALLFSLVVTVLSVAVTWPRAQTQPDGAPDLPLDRPKTATAVAGQGGESAWQERAQMPTRRAHLALESAASQLVAIGGQTPEGVTGAVEAYDPKADVWTPKTAKPTPVAYVGAAAIGSEVYVPGGCDSQTQPTNTVEVFNVDADTWREASPLPEPRCAYALAAQGGKLYLFGGWDGEQYVSSGYVYSADIDEWSVLPSGDVARGFAGAALLNGQLYVVGGYDGEKELTTCRTYDPSARAWNACSPLAVGRGGLGLAAVGGRLYAVGGGGWSSYLGFNERYSPEDDTWSALETPLVGEWRNPGVTVFEGTVYAVGGWSNDYLSLNQAYEALPFRIFIPVSQQ
ncbi:MAG: LuxR C-terminal-related transcriptional regulator [Anaerolineae bacterium]|jgi:DNA-binding CsgD family transcriptional regulator